jgi:ankyrin repeat protein
MAMIKTLLKKGSAVDEKENGLSPLQCACIHGMTAVVKILLFHNATVNKPGPKGRTALHFAVENDHKDIVKLLKQNGARIDVQDIFLATDRHI